MNSIFNHFPFSSVLFRFYIISGGNHPLSSVYMTRFMNLDFLEEKTESKLEKYAISIPWNNHICWNHCFRNILRKKQGSFRSTAGFYKNNFNKIVSTYYMRGVSCCDDPESSKTNC